MDNYGHPGISREFIVHAAGLSGFKRILHNTRIKDTDKLRAIWKHLLLKVENLESAAEKNIQRSGIYQENEECCKLVGKLPVPFRRWSVSCQSVMLTC